MVYPEMAFGGFTRCTGTVAFYSRVDALLKPTDIVLDVGCGRGAHADHPVPYIRRLRDFRGRCASVWGCDVDDAGESNPLIDRFSRITDDGWDVPSESVDLAIADCVIEHVPNPQQFFAEAQRVLKPGGALCIRTPNRWGYVALLATLIPNRAHATVLARVQPNRKAEDVFPTLYRCNTASRLRRAFAAAGFASAVYSHEGEAAYLGNGLAYRLASYAVPLMPPIARNVLLGYGRKA